MKTRKDEEYMKRALELAIKGIGRVNPNPMVGAVIVKNGKIVGEGFHACYGGLHAEREAIKACKEDIEGSTLYVTLEPCCHYGKNPPCTEAILENRFSRVVIGSMDPNPLVAGKGIEILRKSGIEVVTGVLEEECDAQNEKFFHYITTKTPYVMMKYAMTLDGKTATCAGESKWITGEEARGHVHTMRNEYAGIMVGIQTVLEDDPLLTCRVPGSSHRSDPIRIICDTHLKIPLGSQIVRTAETVRTYIATSAEDSNKKRELEKKGCRILNISKKGEYIDLRELMERLGEEKIDSVILEGGGTLNYSALQSGIVQKVQAYIAPKLFGGETATTPVQGAGQKSPKEAFLLCNRKVSFYGEDILLEYEVKKNVYGNC